MWLYRVQMSCLPTWVNNGAYFIAQVGLSPTVYGGSGEPTEWVESEACELRCDLRYPVSFSSQVMSNINPIFPIAPFRVMKLQKLYAKVYSVDAVLVRFYLHFMD
jgi:hypothetical protein